MSSKQNRVRDKVAAYVVGAGLRGLRLLSRRATANFCATMLRSLGPRRHEQEIGRANLAAAYPEKSPQEIEAILRGVWDNLGRVIGEFVHLDRFTAYDPALPGPFDIECSPQTYERFRAMRGKPMLLFGGHLANWELAALAFQLYGLDAVILYRRPNVDAVADAIDAVRGGSMGTLVQTDSRAGLRFARALRAGHQVAMLIDQYIGGGVEVSYFGRKTRANPLVARLARQFECPIYGTYIVRLPDDRFRIELSEPIVPARDAAGKIDVAATTQILTSEIESWVRAHPEQWLWLHRRWRPDDPQPLNARFLSASKDD